MSTVRGKPALMLPGAGARGAYQVGVIKALMDYLPGAESPFPIIAGTSAGAINAAVMASHADNFREGAASLELFWATLQSGQIFKAGWRHNLTLVHCSASRATMVQLSRPRRTQCHRYIHSVTS
ncbi:MAG: patatin-like phospholipase family protein [Woeseiaceae bacterium]|nr:patatin-like phospholipase family protein [Woeseiaceae bacterium]